tara:strand:+ start:3935 stop:4255 length:321 start_codon:yes stop_codon:yes gene_type:complete
MNAIEHWCKISREKALTPKNVSYNQEFKRFMTSDFDDKDKYTEVMQDWAIQSSKHDIENNKRKTISEDNDINIHRVNKLWEGYENTDNPETKKIYKQKIAQYQRRI